VNAASGAVTVYLGLGTNMGDRVRYLRRALYALAVHPEIEVTAFSRIYETEFVGDGEQDPYLNACAAIRTALPPEVLLTVLKAVEAREGRRPGGKWQPRPIDLDILLYGGLVRREAGLVLPHPPDLGETIGERCAKIRRKSGPWIRVYEQAELAPRPANAHKEDWRAALAVHCR
jgi:2-amino-4-hydroxy-6-hydroxymethyldihydropteridine diphosphokinase